MMSTSVKVYEDFGAVDESWQCPQTLNQYEDEKLQSFERGYSAGWEDAQSSQALDSVDRERALIDALSNLDAGAQSASSQLWEAYSNALKEIVNVLFPLASTHSLVALISKKVAQVENGHASFSILASPGDAPKLIDLFSREAPDQIVLADSKVDPGKLRVLVNHDEFEVDFQTTLQEILELLNSNAIGVEGQDYD